MKKFILSCLLSTLCLTVVFSQNYSGTCGENLTWDLKEGTLTISGTGDMSNYVIGYAPWYSQRSSINSVIVSEYVTSIGNSAFANCTGLTSIEIPNSVTSIGSSAFKGCSRLSSMTIPNSVTSIEYGTFNSCTSLTSLTIGNSVTSIGNYAFHGCGRLASIEIPNSVTSIGRSAFKDCSKLSSMTLPNSVTRIGEEAFSGCSKLGSVTIPINITSIGAGAFSGCSNIKSIVWNAQNCNASANTFGSQVETISFGEDVEAIPDGLVASMSSLNTIHLSNIAPWLKQTFTSTTTPLTRATLYLNGEEIKTLTIPEGVTVIGAYTLCNTEKMTEVIIPSSVTTIGQGAFKNGNRLQKIHFGENIESIGDSAFANCPYLIEMHAKMEFSPVIDASVFADCGDLSGIDCYVPKGFMAFYRKTAVWKEFNLIEEITTKGMETITNDLSPNTNKILHNGQIFILRGNKTYTTDGRLVR